VRVCISPGLVVITEDNVQEALIQSWILKNVGNMDGENSKCPLQIEEYMSKS
jgi:hypothetical protein